MAAFQSDPLSGPGWEGGRGGLVSDFSLTPKLICPHRQRECGIYPTSPTLTTQSAQTRQ